MNELNFLKRLTESIDRISTISENTSISIYVDEDDGQVDIVDAGRSQSEYVLDYLNGHSQTITIQGGIGSESIQDEIEDSEFGEPQPFPEIQDIAARVEKIQQLEANKWAKEYAFLGKIVEYEMWDMMIDFDIIPSAELRAALEAQKSNLEAAA